MSERREGHNATRRQTMKRWKVALVAVLTIAMVMQSSNVQAIAEGIAEGLAGDRPVVTDTMPTDGTGTDAATGAEDVTTDETAEDTTSTEATTPEATTPETDETATDTEATEEESTDAPAAPEEVVEDTTETEAPAEAPAEEADTTVTLNVEISGAKLTYEAEDGTEQNVTPETDPKPVDVPNTIDFKFTVTPDEGQQVSSVSYGEAVLTADETGEYTVAAADLTDGEKIVVTTEAVPAEETPAEEAPAEPEEPTEDETSMGAVVPQTLSIRAVDWQSYAVDVQFIDENEQPIDPDGVQGIPYQLDGGTISEYAPKSLVGNNGTTYDFVGAYVGNNEIEFAGSRVSSEGANTYYAVDTDSGIASLLQPGQTIALRYQTHVDRHAITYSVTGIDDSEGLVSGATSVKTGESVDFTVADVYGYTVRVSSNGSELTGDNGVYTLNSVMDNTTVEVAYTANTTYDFTISDEVRGTGKDDGSTNAHGMIDYDELPNQPGINVGEDLTFTIQTIRGQAGANWYLDSLEIENQTVSLPRTYNEGDSATTYLDNGLVVEVVLTSVETRYWVEGDWWNPFDQGHWEEGFPEYTYTVTVSGAKDDVEMTFINFVGSSHHEVMPHFDSEAVVVTYNGSQHGTAQNEKPIQTTGGAVNFLS